MWRDATPSEVDYIRNAVRCSEKGKLVLLKLIFCTILLLPIIISLIYAGIVEIVVSIVFYILVGVLFPKLIGDLVKKNWIDYWDTQSIYVIEVTVTQVYHLGKSEKIVIHGLCNDRELSARSECGLVNIGDNVIFATCDKDKLDYDSDTYTRYAFNMGYR